MEKEVQLTLEHNDQKWENVEYAKKWIDEIYEKRLFYSFSLHTLELTRRFNKHYRLFKENQSYDHLRELLILTERLESIFMEESIGEKDLFLFFTFTKPDRSSLL